MGCVVSSTAQHEEPLEVAKSFSPHGSAPKPLPAQVSLCVAVAGTPITLDSCATPVPSPDCKVQPWAGAPRPVNDSERLQAVAEVAGGIQGQSPAFLPDRYIELCRRIFDAPVVIIDLLSAKCTEIFSHTKGFPYKQHPHVQSACPWTLLPPHPEVLVLPDTYEDARFSQKEWVRGPLGIRTYVGAPLVLTSGYRVGVLCLLYQEPREVDTATVKLLANVTELVVRDIEANVLSKSAPERPSRPSICTKQGMLLVDVRMPGWKVIWANEEACKVSGHNAEGASLWSLFAMPGVVEHPEAHFKAALSGGWPFSAPVSCCTGRDGYSPHCLLEVRPGSITDLDDLVPAGAQLGTPAFLAGNTNDTSTSHDYWFVVVRRLSAQPHVGKAPGSVGREKSMCSTRVQADPHWKLPAKSVQVPTGNADWRSVRLGPLIGRGGFARVHWGRWQNCLVAIKIIRAEMFEHVRRTEDGTPWEVQLTRGVVHPNIVRCLAYGTFQDDSRLKSEKVLCDSASSIQHVTPKENEPAIVQASSYPVMWMINELATKGSLQDAIDRGWFLEEASHELSSPCLRTILQTAREIAEAMRWLHSVCVVHGDLTGSNVLLDSAEKTTSDLRGFVAKISDFGISRRVQKERMTNSYGTCTHMPPEMMTEGQLTPATDVWSFGVLLWEMLSGRRAWAGLAYVRVVQAVAIDGKSPQFPDSAPAYYAALGRRCLLADPSARPPFAAIVEDLDSMLRSTLSLSQLTCISA